MSYGHRQAYKVALSERGRVSGRAFPLCPELSMKKKKCCMGTHPFHCALKQWGLLNPINPAYDRCRPDDQIKLTSSAFNQLDQYVSCSLVTGPTISSLAVAETISSVLTAPTGCSKKTDPLGYFDDNSSKYGPILTIFFTVTRNSWHAKIKLFQPPHLYYVATLPRKTNTDTGISVTCLF